METLIIWHKGWGVCACVYVRVHGLGEGEGLSPGPSTTVQYHSLLPTVLLFISLYF